MGSTRAEIDWRDEEYIEVLKSICSGIRVTVYAVGVLTEFLLPDIQYRVPTCTFWAIP